MRYEIIVSQPFEAFAQELDPDTHQMTGPEVSLGLHRRVFLQKGKSEKLTIEVKCEDLKDIPESEIQEYLFGQEEQQE